ncbi:MAG: Stp1/IreP family PP2C-type Ser/Thr phosphatase [Ruminococcaceae bacterium]|nr:Stp1/IreP family PP2C-type Ser/Thr phosphatase [Oscillospiraceae bacterium]
MHFWGLSDLGCVRKQNEDALFIQQLNKNTLLCVVCDGMGGAKSGNVASSLAADTFAQEVKRTWKGRRKKAAEQLLFEAVNLANDTVYQQSKVSVEYNGMGTTLVAALVHGKTVNIVNVGDSRAYSISAEGIRQITVDHSVVQMMVQRGELTAERAKCYPGKNYITRAIGTEEAVTCDGFLTQLTKGEYLLLCSDGLTNVVNDQEILFEVLHGGTPDTCCQRLIEIAKHRGAPDNVTCALIML